MDPAWDYSAPGFIKKPEAIRLLLRGHHLANAVFDELLSRARWDRPGPWMTPEGWSVDCDVGQAVFGQVELAAKLASTRQQIRTAIRQLERPGIITTEVVKHEATTLGTRATMLGAKQTYWIEQRRQPRLGPTELAMRELVELERLEREATTVQPEGGHGPTSNKTSPDLGSFFSSREPPDPDHDGGGDRVRGERCIPGDGAAALADLIARQRRAS